VILLIAAFAVLAFATPAADNLEQLQELPEAGLPTDAFQAGAFEAIDLGTEAAETEAEGSSFIEGESAGKTKTGAEAKDKYWYLRRRQAMHDVSLNVPVMAIRQVRIPVVRGQQAREMEFARIQYLQAAIASKRDAIAAQKQALSNEEAQIRRESKLVKLNRAILRRNEAQINRAQRELAKLVDTYSAGLRAGFSVDDAINEGNPIVAIPRPVAVVRVAAESKKVEEKPEEKKAEDKKVEEKPASDEKKPAFGEVEANMNAAEAALQQSE